jgi:hypothetical protein
MQITLTINNNVHKALEKIADLEDRTVEELIGEGVRTYIQAAFDSELGDYFDLKTDDPILEK